MDVILGVIDIENWKQWVWIEASGKIKEMCHKNNAFNVPSEYAVLYLNGIPYTQIDEYHYSRMISGREEQKTIFGFKDKETLEIIRQEINDKVNDFLNTLKKDKLNEMENRQQELYNRYIQKKGELQRYKDIIDYFVYLKNDEGINEFPSESFEILKSAVRELKHLTNDINIDNRYIIMAIEEGENVIRTSTELYPLAI